MKRILSIAIVLFLCGPAFAALCGDLKQSTSVTITFGPIVSAADGYTPEAALTLHAAHIYVAKNGGSLAAKNSSTAPTYDRNGCYKVTLDATDTGTRGILFVNWEDANDVVIVPQVYNVLDPNDWNQKYSTGEVAVYSFGTSKAAVTAAVDAFTNAYSEPNNGWNIDEVKGAPPLSMPGYTDIIKGFRVSLWEAAYPGDANDNSPAKELYGMRTFISGLTGTPSVNLVTDIAALKTILDKLDTAMVLDGAVYQFTSNALENGAAAAVLEGAITNTNLTLDEAVGEMLNRTKGNWKK